MERTIYPFKVSQINGQSVELSAYKGKVLLIVNTASACGFTPQLEALEKIYKKYKDRGFEILGFPSNDFMGQEPLEGDAIGQFCQRNYGVTFPIFNKVHVKGRETDPLFKFLSDKKLNGRFSSIPKWNFHKYLINRQGEAVDYFYTFTRPDADRLVQAIEKLL